MAMLTHRFTFFIIFCGISSCAGALWYAIHNQHLIVYRPTRLTTATEAQKASHKTIECFSWRSSQWASEKVNILWPEDTAQAAHGVIAAWLALMQEEKYIAPTVEILQVTSAFSTPELFINLSSSLFTLQQSIFAKWMLLESLLKTLSSTGLPYTHIHLLVNHQHLHDDSLDCSQPFLSSGYVTDYQKYVPKTLPYKSTHNVISLVVDPQGDSKKTGRIIGTDFERTLSFSCADYLKKQIVQSGIPINIELTRSLGATREPMQHALLANSIPADWFCNLAFYQSPEQLPHITIYFPLYSPEIDFWPTKRSELMFTSIDKTYQKYHTTSVFLAHYCVRLLKNNYADRMIISGPYGLPVTALIGVEVPGCVIECGVPSAQDIESLKQPLCYLFKAVGGMLAAR